MPYCPKCGEAVHAGDAFCMECGEAVDTVVSDPEPREPQAETENPGRASVNDPGRGRSEQRSGQDLTRQSFEADPVALPEAAREELVLAETGRESPTLEFNDPRGDGQITITNRTAVYHRGPARGTSTALEAFTGMVNGTPGSGSNINAVGNEIGIDQAGLGVFEGTPTIGGDNVSVVLPAGARASDGSVMHSMRESRTWSYTEIEVI